MPALSEPIPVIDLFAGPGGLGEGFSAATDSRGRVLFDVRLSVEKEEIAHRTLELRALFRALRRVDNLGPYYDYVHGRIARTELFGSPPLASAVQHARKEARQMELGVTPSAEVDACIRDALGATEHWLLIGGPPCQAYSLAGRSRMRSADPEKFENDSRHFLYREYLRVIREHKPSAFIMENVKGMLSSTHAGSLIFDRIIRDLQEPGAGLTYRIRSLAVDSGSLKPRDFLIRSERHGLPQARHRVILFGVRSDLFPEDRLGGELGAQFALHEREELVSVGHVLEDLPRVRSRLSREPDSHASWLRVHAQVRKALTGWRSPKRSEIETRLEEAAGDAAAIESVGGSVIAWKPRLRSPMPADLEAWLLDPEINGLLQHESRGHMRPDLHRYVFAAAFAEICGYSPTLDIYPQRLLPEHKNVVAQQIPFADRFRVQVRRLPSTTVVSHIAKDGHYYIHPDPAQCRSLTVREAARLQTFPDNYYFEGNRTQQYWQVGNAVPPFLAKQIADVVAAFSRFWKR